VREDCNVTRWVDTPNTGAAMPASTVEPRLLPGEDPDTELLEDVTHWLSVYTELLDSRWGLLDGRGRVLNGVDDKLVLAQLQRLEDRLDFWLHKSAQLTP
jgi:hypothetical protein